MRSAARRVVGRVGSAIGLIVTFVVATASAVVLHLDLPAIRRLVATQVSGVLGSTLKGDVRIERIASLGLSGVKGVRVRVRDADGVQVLYIEDVTVRIRALDLARSALFGSSPVVIDVPVVSVVNVDANLDGDEAGNLRIANAFLPKKPSEHEDPNAPPGRGVRVEVPSIRLQHAWVHGTPPGAPLVDVDISALAARAHVDPSVVRADLEQVNVLTRALPRQVDPSGTLSGAFAMPAPNGKGMDVQALFKGVVAGIPTTIEGRLNDQRVDARVDAHDPNGAHASAIVKELSLHEPLSLHAEAHGQLPHVDGDVRIVLGAASVLGHAAVEASEPLRVKASVTARNVNAAALSKDAPPTNIGLDALADVAIDPSGVHGHASIETVPGTVEEQAVPPLAIQGKFAGKSAELRAQIREATMPTEIRVDVTPRGGGPDNLKVIATARSRIPDLRRVPKVGAMVSGSADIDASALLLLPEQQIVESEVKVVIRKIRAGQLTLGRIEAKARASGRVDRAVIDAEVHARELVTGAIPLATLDARARVEIVDKSVTIKDPSVEALRLPADKLAVKAHVVRIDGSRVRLEAAEIRGLGAPIHAELAKDGGEIRGHIDAPKVDLALVARLLGQADTLAIERGTLAVQAEGKLHQGVANAKLHAALDDLSMRSVKGAHAVVDATIDDRNVDVALEADVGEAATLHLRTDRVVIAGRIDDPRSWKGAAGRVLLDLGVDLQRASLLLPEGTLPLADLRGRLSVVGNAGRDTPTSPPEVQIHAHTNGLFVAGPSGKRETVGATTVEEPARWRSTGLDVGLEVRTDGPSGFTSVAFRATDPHGAVVALDAKSLLPYAELVDNPAAARARLLAAPMSIKIVVPPRRLDQLPSIVALTDLDGAVDADLEASGTILDPLVRFSLHSRGVRSSALPPDTSIDADVALDYDGVAANLGAKLRSRGAELLTAASHVELRSRDLLAGSGEGEGGAPLPWKASARVKLASFPLETVPALVDRRIKGKISGEVRLDGLHEDAHVRGRIDIADLAIGGVAYPTGRVLLQAGSGQLRAGVRLDQVDGFLAASVKTGLLWGTDVTPSFDAKQPIEASLVAKDFRAAAIQPFVEATLPTLDGRIDANATARVVPGTPGAVLDGKVSLREGVIAIAALGGEELRGVRATATFSRDGTIRVTDVVAKGTQGEVQADAFAKIDGMRLAKATANIRIPEEQPLSLAVQGQPIGELTGAIKIEASQSADAKNTRVVVEVPRFKLELPKMLKTGVQTLDDNEKIRVGVYRERRSFVRLPLEKADLDAEAEAEVAADPTRLDVDVRLGKISIERGNQLRVNLTGNPKISVEGGKTKMHGQIQIESGWVDVQGKKFEVDHGTVTFNGESPPNPVVVATAGWTAADGSRIFADFVGPVASGKFTLRSEPPRTQSEILGLILFGTASGANPQQSPGKQSDGDGSTQAAAGIGGGFAAQGLTEALNDVGGVQATARIDTTRSDNPRPEVEFQVAPRVTIGFAHVLGQPPITDPDKNLATVEYRFYRNWSLETTFGDRGTSLLDAIWQRRY